MLAVFPVREPDNPSAIPRGCDWHQRPPRSMLACRCAMSRKPPRTRTRGPPCDTTAPECRWTGCGPRGGQARPCKQPQAELATRQSLIGGTKNPPKERDIEMRPPAKRIVPTAAASLTALAASGLLPAAAAQPDGAQAVLTAVSGTGTGSVLIAPTAQDHGTFAVEVTVDIHDAAPSTTYTVGRAVDSSQTESAPSPPDGWSTARSPPRRAVQGLAPSSLGYWLAD